MLRAKITAAFPRLKRIALSRKVVALCAAVVAYALFGFFAVPPLLKWQLTHFAADTLQRRASIGKTTFNPFLFKLEINDFALVEKGGAPIVGFQRLFVDLELSSVLRWAWTLADITIDGLDLRVDVRPDGRLNLAVLADSFPKSEKKSERPPRLLLQHAALNRGTIVFSDHSDPTPASMTVKPIDLELRDVSTLPEHRGPYSVKATLPDGGSVAWRGEMSLQPVYSRGEVSLKGLRTATAWNFLQDELKFSEPAGGVDLGARYAFSFAARVPQLTIEGIHSRLSGLVLRSRGAEQPLLKLDEAEIADGRFDLEKREVVLPMIAVRHGAVSAAVDEAGVINWQTVVPADRKEPARPQAEKTKAKPWHVKVQAVRIEDIALDYQDHSRAVPLDLAVGAAGAACSAAFDIGAAKAGAVISDLKVSLSQLKLSGDRSNVPLIALDSAVLEGGNLELEERKLAIQQVTVRGGASSIVREAGGGIPLLDVMAGKRDREATTPQAGDEAKSAPWTFELAQFDAEDLRLALADRTQSPAIAYDVTGMRLSLKDIRNDGNTPIKVDGSLRVAQGGAAAISGTVSQTGDRVAARFSLERLNLKPLQPLVAARAALDLGSAELSTRLQVTYRGGKTRPELRVRGPASVDNLVLKESATGERFLAWRALSTPEFALSIAPDRLRINELRLVEPNAKIVIFKDRSVNLVKVLKSPAASSEEVQTSQKPSGHPAKPAGTGAARDFPITIGRIKAEQGTVDFADYSLALPFATKVQELSGEASGISVGQPGQSGRTALNFEGRVEDYGLARAEGSLNAADPKEFTDIRVTFRNVDMPPLSPYTATFAGRKISSGKLALDLHYKIQNSELSGDNGVVLERFTLGERVEAPGALDLPLDLAVALLTDTDGRINVAVPVRGNVDHPEFSYGHLIWQAIRTLLTRIVTAPFRALASLFGGGGGENLDSIPFDPGRAVLLPPEREKLKRIAEVLGKRPQLRLVIQGEYAEPDRQALQRRAARQAIAAKMGRAISPEEDPGQPNLADAKTQRALEAVYVERSGEQALTQLTRTIGEARGQPVQRVNPVLGLLGRASQDVSFYEALLARVAETMQVPNASLQKLADHRAQQVTDDLTKVNNISSERLQQRPAASEGAPGNAPQVKFALAAAPGGGN